MWMSIQGTKKTSHTDSNYNDLQFSRFYQEQMQFLGSYDTQAMKNIYRTILVKLSYSSSAHNLLHRDSTTNL
jgi:hypothetical protein